jgi:hypothetical protein
MDKSFVLEKLEKKRELDPDCIGFGVERHCYKLQPPIEESRLVALEKKYGVALPEDYRKFILTVGNGGAGPSYGLYSIEGALTGKADKTYNYPGSGVGDDIKKPFVRPDDVDEDDEEYSDDYGMMILCQHGCANDDYLIVNGRESGFVWEFIEWVGHHIPLLKNMPDLTFINDLPQEERPDAEQKWIRTLLSAEKDEKMTFTDWYLDWLEKPPHILPGAKKRQAEKKRKSWFKRW